MSDCFFTLVLSLIRMRTAHVPADFYFRGHDSSWYGRIVPCGKTQYLTLGRKF